MPVPLRAQGSTSEAKQRVRPVAWHSRSLWLYLAVLVVSAFILNWIWEMIQMPAYAEMAGWPWFDTVATCTWAALGDVAITLGIYGTGALALRDLGWAWTGRWPVFAAAAFLGAVCAVVFERLALAAGRWSYSDRMPMVPVPSVGLWPLLQLTLLVPLAFWLASRW